MDLTSEIIVRTARSGGKGGQNVNKVETMAEAWWYIPGSRLVSTDDKALIATKLANRINKDGYLMVRCSETRSQLENREIAIRRLNEMVTAALVRPKKRRPTKPGKAAVERRLEGKRRDAEKKAMRRNDW